MRCLFLCLALSLAHAQAHAVSLSSLFGGGDAKLVVSGSQINIDGRPHCTIYVEPDGGPEVTDIVARSKSGDEERTCLFQTGRPNEEKYECEPVLTWPKACAEIESVTINRFTCSDGNSRTDCGEVTVEKADDLAAEVVMAPEAVLPADDGPALDLVFFKGEDDKRWGCSLEILPRALPVERPVDIDLEYEITNTSGAKGKCIASLAGGGGMKSCGIGGRMPSCSALAEVIVTKVTCKHDEAEVECGTVTATGSGLAATVK